MLKRFDQPQGDTGYLPRGIFNGGPRKRVVGLGWIM